MEEDTNQASRQARDKGRNRIPRSPSFWISMITFLMLFGLLLTGVTIAIIRLIRMLTS